MAHTYVHNRAAIAKVLLAAADLLARREEKSAVYAVNRACADYYGARAGNWHTYGSQQAEPWQVLLSDVRHFVAANVLGRDGAIIADWLADKAPVGKIVAVDAAAARAEFRHKLDPAGVDRIEEPATVRVDAADDVPHWDECAPPEPETVKITVAELRGEATVESVSVVYRDADGQHQRVGWGSNGVAIPVGAELTLTCDAARVIGTAKNADGERLVFSANAWPGAEKLTCASGTVTSGKGDAGPNPNLLRSILKSGGDARLLSHWNGGRSGHGRFDGAHLYYDAGAYVVEVTDTDGKAKRKDHFVGSDIEALDVDAWRRAREQWLSLANGKGGTRA